MTEQPAENARYMNWRIVDSDVHLHEAPSDLARNCELRWRNSLEMMQDVGYVSIPGLSHVTQLDPPLEHTIPGRVAEHGDVGQQLDLLGVNDAILYPDNLLFVGMIPNRLYAAAVVSAYNRWLMEEVTAGGGLVNLYGAIIAYPHDPAKAAREVHLWGGHAHAAAVIVPVVGTDPPLGDPFYDPIYEAAQEVDLPVVFHSGQAIHPTFPFNTHGFDTEFARHAIAHSFSIMASVISVLSTGVPERFPSLKLAFVEGGYSWIPFLRHRLDREFLSLRRQTPWLRRLPSEYMADFYYSTQPLGLEPDKEAAVSTMRDCYLDSRLMFSTDWPHHDFDHPRAVIGLGLTEQELTRLYSENALDFFRMKR